ncbi:MULTISPECIES: hypothetical protein [unclassified Streptomyces]|uniref:hypothetical protein n=1 Tax=Streptomyces sp. NPDC127532 TaxID=3345399 RepID=UPI0036257DE0
MTETQGRESDGFEDEFDYDAWDDDSWEFEEPVTTYAEAVAALRVKARTRADVTVQWNGGRGQRDDARIIFSGPKRGPEHRVRLRSASQLGAFSGILESAFPLPGRQALWYERDGIISARLVGDYESLPWAVARSEKWNVRRKDMKTEGPLRDDFLGTLAHRGAFLCEEPPVPPAADARKIRITRSDEALEVLYRRRLPQSLSVALELSGFSFSDPTEAEEALVEYGTSYCHEIARNAGVSLRLWNPDYALNGRSHRERAGRVKFPVRTYDAIPAEMYAAATSTGRDSLERYLKYYQVLEFYMGRAADTCALAQGKKVNEASSPYGTKPLRTERGKLDAVIDAALTTTQVTGHLVGDRLLPDLSNPQLITGVHCLPVGAAFQPVAGTDYRSHVSERVYDLRCRIVHAKEGGGGKRPDVILPAGREARDLGPDIQLVAFLAERALQHWATPLT